jgi:hypothetical protein
MLLWPGLVCSQNTRSIFDTGSERIGYYQKQGDRIDVFDRSWERKGHIILNGQNQDYYDKGFERVDPERLLRELEK